jgi:hypothetical protein
VGCRGCPIRNCIGVWVWVWVWLHSRVGVRSGQAWHGVLGAGLCIHIYIYDINDELGMIVETRNSIPSADKFANYMYFISGRDSATYSIPT